MTHAHAFCPGHSLKRTPMLWCSCGAQINCERDVGRKTCLMECL